MTVFSDILGSILTTPSTAKNPYEKAVEDFPKAIKTYVRKLEGQGREVDFIRMSGAHALCPRQFVLNYWQPVIEEQVNFENCLFMDMGTMLHSYLQEGMLGPCGVLIGHWQNKETGDIVEGAYPGEFKSLRDFRDSPNKWAYVEPTVWHEGWRFSGHCDGICDEDRLQVFVDMALRNADPKNIAKKICAMPVSKNKILLEIKTCNSRIMENLVTPADILDPYKTQATMYQKLTDIKSTMFWYFNRDSFATKALIYKSEIARYSAVERKAEIIWTSIRDKELPTSLMPCASPKDTRAQRCNVAEACWKMNIPFKNFIERAMENQPDRQWLDLSSWEPPVSYLQPASNSSTSSSL